MSIRIRRPEPADLEELRIGSTTCDLTYGPVGVAHDPSLRATTPAGFRRDHWSVDLPAGPRSFETAAAFVHDWGVQRGAGLVVCANGPPVAGQVVAMGAPLPVGWIDVVCRVVAVVDDPDRSGFVYGTLPDHPERGEESFMICRDPDGTIRFEIDAVSRSRHPLARLAPPVARLLQRRATGRYLDAVSAATR
jgi:uncharacterized protein (UPF0548 family)